MGRRAVYDDWAAVPPRVVKKPTTYEAIAPDGSKLREASFQINEPKAVMYIYPTQGGWNGTGIWKEPAFDAGAGKWVDARRVR